MTQEAYDLIAFEIGLCLENMQRAREEMQRAQNRRKTLLSILNDIPDEEKERLELNSPDIYTGTRINPVEHKEDLVNFLKGFSDEIISTPTR